MHSVRRHELGAVAVLCIISHQRCIPCGDMSWEIDGGAIGKDGHMMHSVRRHELGDDFVDVFDGVGQDAFRAET